MTTPLDHAINELYKAQLSNACKSVTKQDADTLTFPFIDNIKRAARSGMREVAIEATKQETCGWFSIRRIGALNDKAFIIIKNTNNGKAECIAGLVLLGTQRQLDQYNRLGDVPTESIASPIQKMVALLGQYRFTNIRRIARDLNNHGTADISVVHNEKQLVADLSQDLLTVLLPLENLLSKFDDQISATVNRNILQDVLADITFNLATIEGSLDNKLNDFYAYESQRDKKDKLKHALQEGITQLRDHMQSIEAQLNTPTHTVTEVKRIYAKGETRNRLNIFDILKDSIQIITGLVAMSGNECLGMARGKLLSESVDAMLKTRDLKAMYGINGINAEQQLQFAEKDELCIFPLHEFKAFKHHRDIADSLSLWQLSIGGKISDMDLKQITSPSSEYSTSEDKRNSDSLLASQHKFVKKRMYKLRRGSKKLLRSGSKLVTNAGLAVLDLLVISTVIGPFISKNETGHFFLSCALREQAKLSKYSKLFYSSGKRVAEDLYPEASGLIPSHGSEVAGAFLFAGNIIKKATFDPIAALAISSMSAPELAKRIHAHWTIKSVTDDELMTLLDNIKNEQKEIDERYKTTAKEILLAQIENTPGGHRYIPTVESDIPVAHPEPVYQPSHHDILVSAAGGISSATRIFTGHITTQNPVSGTVFWISYALFGLPLLIKSGHIAFLDWIAKTFSVPLQMALSGKEGIMSAVTVGVSYAKISFLLADAMSSGLEDSLAADAIDLIARSPASVMLFVGLAWGICVGLEKAHIPGISEFVKDETSEAGTPAIERTFFGLKVSLLLYDLVYDARHELATCKNVSEILKAVNKPDRIEALVRKRLDANQNITNEVRNKAVKILSEQVSNTLNQAGGKDLEVPLDLVTESPELQTTIDELNTKTRRTGILLRLLDVDLTKINCMATKRKIELWVKNNFPEQEHKDLRKTMYWALYGNPDGSPLASSVGAVLSVLREYAFLMATGESAGAMLETKDCLSRIADAIQITAEGVVLDMASTVAMYPSTSNQVYKIQKKLSECSCFFRELYQFRECYTAPAGPLSTTVKKTLSHSPELSAPRKS